MLQKKNPDLADYLVKKGLPFRSAYKTVGEIVGLCIREQTVLDDLPLARYQEFSPLFAEDLYADIDPVACVEKRNSYGGTGFAQVEAQIEEMRKLIK